MKSVLEDLLGFIYLLSMGDYFFFIGTFLLIVLFIYIVYLIKCSDEESEDVLSDAFDIEQVQKSLEKNYKPEVIKLTSYEEEQENNAIISYEELISNKNKLNVGYDDEYSYEGDGENLTVKKIELMKSKSSEIKEPKLEVKLMSYEKEEDFLRTLKELQSNLSH
jgi:hypothetical protein